MSTITPNPSNWFSFPPCNGGSCVDVEPAPNGVRLTSTLGPDKGSVEYTHQEWAEFLDKVKAGQVDGTVHPEFRLATVAA